MKALKVITFLLSVVVVALVGVIASQSQTIVSQAQTINQVEKAANVSISRGRVSFSPKSRIDFSTDVNGVPVITMDQTK